MLQRTNPNLPTHDGRSFSWEGNTGYAEVSDLGRGADVAGRAFPDACDMGFYVRSHKTGARKLFLETGVRRLDGDVISWIYTTDDGFTVEIFND